MVDTHRDPEDLRFHTLLDEALRLAEHRAWPPGQSPSNPSSTARAVLEAAALIGDQIAFQVAQLPERLRGPLLELLDLRPFPARSATVHLEFRLVEPATEPVVIPRGTRVTTRDGDVTFSTARDLSLGPAVLTTLVAQRHHDGPFEFFGGLVFGDPVTPGDAFLIGLAAPLPGCLVEIELALTPSGTGVDPTRPPLAWECWDGDHWTACEVVADSTGGLNRPGSVVLGVPSGHEESVVADQRAAWLRCRVTEPEPGRPGYAHSPVITADVRVATIGGVVLARHGVMVVDEPLGTSTGEPAQRFRTRHRPVLTQPPPVVEVGGEDGWDTWTVVPTFVHSGSFDRHARVDSAEGVVEFGPEIQAEPTGLVDQKGAQPPAGALVRVQEYWVGGGSAGNVPARTLEVIADPALAGLTVTNPVAAWGGADAESVDDLWRRAPFALRARDRAVTAADYEYLAREVAPELARVHCMRGGRGEAQVLCVPHAEEDARGQLRFGDLEPPGELVQRVAEYLDERRVIGTRVIVAAPRYLGVTVVAGVVRGPGRRARTVADDASRALNRYLNPLTGGPHGTGWPFGRPVHIGDVFAVLQQVDGVDRIADARLYVTDIMTGRRDDATTVVALDPDCLVISYEHQVRVEEP